MNHEPTHRLLRTIPESAAQLHVGRSTIYQLIRAGEIETVKIGRCTRIPADALEAFVHRLRAGTTKRPL